MASSCTRFFSFVLCVFIVVFVLGGSVEPKSSEEVVAVQPIGQYKIDSVHSCALFRVQHLGAGLFWGRFNEVTGTIIYG